MEKGFCMDDKRSARTPNVCPGASYAVRENPTKGQLQRSCHQTALTNRRSSVPWQGYSLWKRLDYIKEDQPYQRGSTLQKPAMKNYSRKLSCSRIYLIVMWKRRGYSLVLACSTSSLWARYSLIPTFSYPTQKRKPLVCRVRNRYNRLVG